MVCPLIQVLLSGVKSPETNRDMANLDTWITSSKPPDNIVLSSYRVAIWDTLCSNASDSIDKSLPSGVLYLPIWLTNPHINASLPDSSQASLRSRLLCLTAAPKLRSLAN